jgi:hypothetical protein
MGDNTGIGWVCPEVFRRVVLHLNYAHGEHPGRSPRSVEVTQVE